MDGVCMVCTPVGTHVLYACYMTCAFVLCVQACCVVCLNISVCIACCEAVGMCTCVGLNMSVCLCQHMGVRFHMQISLCEEK